MRRFALVILLATMQNASTHTSNANSNANQRCEVVQVDGEILTANNEILDDDSWECITYDTDGVIERIYTLSTRDIHPKALERLAAVRAMLPVNRAKLSTDNTTLLYAESLPNLANENEDDDDDEDIGSNLQTEQAVLGAKTVLVVRLLMDDISPTVSAAEVSDAIFGAGHLNMCTQFAACSKNQFTLSPANGVDIEGGVLDIEFRNASTDFEKGQLSGVVDRELKAKYGSIAAFDFVMICTPPAWGSWLAFAQLGGRYSTYRDRSILFLSFQMHEVGHNLRLHHSGTPGNEYGDTIGMMGYSFTTMYGPVMCYNAAKNYQLGWFSDCEESRERVYVPDNAVIRTELIGSADYSVGTCTGKHKVTLRYWDLAHSLYISYNKKTGTIDGSTAGTAAAGDQVVLHVNNNNAGKSIRVGTLNRGQTVAYVFTNYPEPLHVQWCEIVDGRAVVAVSTTYSYPCSIPIPLPPETNPTPETPETTPTPWEYDEFGWEWEKSNSAPHTRGTPPCAFAMMLALLTALLTASIRNRS